MSNENDIVKVTENWLKESGTANKILEDINAGKIKCEYNENFKKTITMHGYAKSLLDWIDKWKLYDDPGLLVKLGYSEKYHQDIYILNAFYLDKFYSRKNK